MSRFGHLNINIPPGGNLQIGNGGTMHVGSDGPARDTAAPVLDPLFERLDALSDELLADFFRDASLQQGMRRTVPAYQADTDILLAYAARRMQRIPSAK